MGFNEKVLNVVGMLFSGNASIAINTGGKRIKRHRE